MDAIALSHKVVHEIVDTANDIDSYLASDVPIECYRKDIDLKLMAMKERIAVMILETTGLPVQVVNSVRGQAGEWQGGYREPLSTDGHG
jgi:hypothetical protein